MLTPELPISPFITAIRAAVRDSGVVVLKAEPGAGKTTTVPPALLADLSGKIIVLEPRRLAAKLAAEFVASSLGEPVGRTVGYQIRFESRVSKDTRLIFVTEGVFVRMLQDDPALTGIAAVIIDEFHERHIDTDLALGLVKSLRSSVRPDLALVVMSATIDVGAVHNFLPGSTSFDVPGRAFPVAIEYFGENAQALVEDRVVAAVKRILQDGRCTHNVLVFLTGIDEIMRCARRCEALAREQNVLLLPLTAEVPPAEQARVFAPGDRRKVVFATNVAETSLTLPDITGVIDGGTAKIAGHAPWSGLTTLTVKRISKASCIQRAGRAGRTRPGVCYRLYQEADYLARQDHTPPEILRIDLSQTLLTVGAVEARMRQLLGTTRAVIEWLEPPDREALAQAQELLTRLAAIDPAGHLTEKGLRMARMPVHPRLAAMLVAGEEQGIGALAALGAAMINEGMLFMRGARASTVAACDVRYQMEAITKQETVAVDQRRKQRILAAYSDLVGGSGRRASLPKFPLSPEQDSAFTAALLAGFPDRVAQLRVDEKARGRAFNLCRGRGGILHEGSVCREEDLVIAIEAMEGRSPQNAAYGTQITIASGLSLESLLSDTAGFLREETVSEWQESGGKYISFARLWYGELLLEERRVASTESGAASLEAKVREGWPAPFESGEDLAVYHRRLEILDQCQIKHELPRFVGEMLDLLIAAVCEGKSTFAAIRAQSLADYVGEQLSYDQRQLLDGMAPLSLALPSGRRIKINYEVDKPPWAGSRLQDFFGMKVSPTIAAGRLPLTLHLLAPNQRAVQVTSDLASFWQRSYPELKGQLSRRYPRHSWPEDPLTATPPPPMPPRQPRSKR